MDTNLEKYIRENVKHLTDVYDSFNFLLPNNKGVFVMVDNVDPREGWEYFIELNDVDEDGAFEPCGYWNDYTPFGDINELVKRIETYLKLHDISVNVWNEV